MPGIDDAYHFQNDASSFVRNEIQKVLEELLDKYDQPGKIIRIEKLELDISDIEFTQTGIPFLTETFRSRLDEQLAQQIHAEKNKTQTSSEKQNLFVYDESEDLLELVLYYFRNGYLPWWASHYSEIIVRDEVKKLITGRPADLITGIKQNFKSSRFRTRMVNHIETESLFTLIPEILQIPYPFQKIFIKAITFIQTKNDLLIFLDKLSDQKHNSQKELVQTFAALFDLARKNTSFSESNFLEETISSDSAADTVIHAITAMKKISNNEKEEILNIFAGKHILLQNPKLIRKLIQSVSSDSKESSGLSESQLQKNSEVNFQHENNSIEEFIRENQTEFQEEKENYIPAQQAGLVILQPYLLPFFKSLKLLNENLFLSEKEQHHAVHILHLIACGEDTSPEEHELVFHKILCGLEPETVLNEKQTFAENEKTETEELLKSVIENWPALKSTSVQGLREMFLKRPGNLRQEPNGWNLHIERETHDILLDKLPWGISMLKAPWNEQMIYVEW